MQEICKVSIDIHFLSVAGEKCSRYRYIPDIFLGRWTEWNRTLDLDVIFIVHFAGGGVSHWCFNCTAGRIYVRCVIRHTEYVLAYSPTGKVVFSDNRIFSPGLMLSPFKIFRADHARKYQMDFTNCHHI